MVCSEHTQVSRGHEPASEEIMLAAGGGASSVVVPQAQPGVAVAHTATAFEGVLYRHYSFSLECAFHSRQVLVSLSFIICLI